MLKSLSILSGVAAIASGLLFGLVQLIHPPGTLAAVETGQWLLAHLVTFAFAILALPGLTGIYLRQAEQTRWWGFVGYLALAGAFVLMICFAFYEAFVAPGLVFMSPEYVADGLAILEGGVGPLFLGPLYQVNGALYMLGGLIFALVTLRAGVFPRWASGLLLAGLLLTLSAAVVPAMARPSAVVFGLGFAALGWALIRAATSARNEARAVRRPDGGRTRQVVPDL